MDKYILDGHTPVPCSEPGQWEEWFEKAWTEKARIVKQEHLGKTLVSTVFLGLNHNFGGMGPPLLFETMVFPSSDNLIEEYCRRCSTWEQAEEQHKQAVEWVKNNKTAD